MIGFSASLAMDSSWLDLMEDCRFIPKHRRSLRFWGQHRYSDWGVRYRCTRNRGSDDADARLLVLVLTKPGSEFATLKDGALRFKNDLCGN